MPAETIEHPSEKQPLQVELNSDQLAGLQPWFLNPSKGPALDRICRAGFVHVWSTRVEDSLRANEWHQGRPSTWGALARAIGRNPEGFTVYPNYQKKLISNKTPRMPDPLVGHAVTWALGPQDNAIVPSVSEWITHTTKFLLLKYGALQTKRLSGDIDLTIYGLYMSKHFVPPVTGLALALVGEVLQEMNNSVNAAYVEEAILYTADRVGGILKSHFNGKNS